MWSSYFINTINDNIIKFVPIDILSVDPFINGLINCSSNFTNIIKDKVLMLLSSVGSVSVSVFLMTCKPPLYMGPEYIKYFSDKTIDVSKNGRIGRSS